MLRPTQRPKRLIARGAHAGTLTGNGSNAAGRPCSVAIFTPCPRRATAFDLRALAFGAQPALDAAAPGLGGDTWLGDRQRRVQQIEQARARIFAVALLGAVALGAEHQYAVCGDPEIGRAHV